MLAARGGPAAWLAGPEMASGQRRRVSRRCQAGACGEVEGGVDLVEVAATSSRNLAAAPASETIRQMGQSLCSRLGSRAVGFSAGLWRV